MSFTLSFKKKPNHRSTTHYRFNYLFKTKSTFVFKFFNLIKNNYLIFIFFNNVNSTFNTILLNYFKFNFNIKSKLLYLIKIYKQSFGEGYVYLRGLFIIFFTDACVTDDEPL